MFDLKKIKNAIASLGSEQKKLTNEVEALKQRREELNALPRSREDLADVVDAWLVGQRGVFLDALNRNIKYLVSNPDTTISPETDLRIFSNTDALGMIYPRDGNLLGLLAPLIRDQLKDAILELKDYPKEAGPAYPLRVKEIEKLDKQISDLEGSITKLQQQANDAGIQLEPAQEPKRPDYSGGEPVNPEARQAAFEKANS